MVPGTFPDSAGPHQSTTRRFAPAWQRLQAPLVIADDITLAAPPVPVALTYAPDPRLMDADV